MHDMSSALRIGITIGLQSPDETLWNNGIKQNALFLMETLRHCDNVAFVTLVNTTSIAVTSQLPWDLNRWPCQSFEDVKDSLDVLIELGGQVNFDQTSYLKQRGCRLVSYCCGFEYITALEAIVLGRRMWDQVFINQRYDDIWVIPQIAPNSLSFFEVLRRQTARVVPFVWDPFVLEGRCKDLPHSGLYVPGRPRKRLSVIEPNVNIVKFCLYPILTAEALYREVPDRIEILQVTNAERIATQSPEFISLMNQLDLVKDHKAVFWGRFDTPALLAHHTDLVLSHQLENALNYLYLEVCWQGYPLIHNAHLVADLGYYYEGHDVRAATQCAKQALEQHDDAHERYRSQQRARIGRFLSTNSQVQNHYAALLQQLIARPIRM